MNEARRRYGTNVWIIYGLGQAGDVVFHRWAAPYLTRCGRPIYTPKATSVHIHHARRFARPCHQCWRVEQLALEIPIGAVT